MCPVDSSAKRVLTAHSSASKEDFSGACKDYLISDVLISAGAGYIIIITLKFNVV